MIAASLIRAVHAPAQLREVLAQFWHDYFNVNSAKAETTVAFFPHYDAMLRANALGNFRKLLGEVTRSAAMLYYLNNVDSIASPANENFARELLELHTLGARNYLNDRCSDWRKVPGAAEGAAAGYLDMDVYEVARAFTGWSMGDGRWIAEGENAPRMVRFHYVERWHDPYQKRILGREFPPNRAPMADGEAVLDILARHPGTARFVCEKLARRLLSDDPPPGLVDRMAAVFLEATEAPDQIARVLRVLVGADEFLGPPTKLRRPFETLAALYRATGAEVTATENGWVWRLVRAGWQQHEFGPPTGHPDRLQAWTGASTLNHAEGLPEATRSHFDAEARIERGLFGGALPPGDPSGWIGRWLQAAAPGGPMPALAVGAMRPASLLGAQAAAAETLGDLMLGQGHWLAPALRARLVAGFGDHGPLA